LPYSFYLLLRKKNNIKNLIKLGFSALLPLDTITEKAQNIYPEKNNSLLLEVSGSGLSKPSYTVGAFHILCNKDFNIKPKIWNAHNQA